MYKVCQNLMKKLRFGIALKKGVYVYEAKRT